MWLCLAAWGKQGSLSLAPGPAAPVPSGHPPVPAVVLGRAEALPHVAVG